MRAPHGEHPLLGQRLAPASEESAGLGDVVIRALACCTWSTTGCTSLTSRGCPTGTCRGTKKPAADSASIPGWRPHGAAPWHLPVPMGAIVGSYALPIGRWVSTWPCVNRRDWCAIR
jgi:hypothetical protein